MVDLLPGPQYFYAVNNRMIYGAMLDMFTLGLPVDFVTVLEQLKENRNFDEATGKVYLTQLAQLVPSISHVESYAKIVRDKYDLRTDAGRPEHPQRRQRGGAGRLSAAGFRRAAHLRYPPGQEHPGPAVRAGDPAGDLRPAGQAQLRGQGQIPGLPTGIKELDNTITGLNRSDLIVLAARPGVGKTSFGLNIARHVSVTAGRRVAFFSLEMGREQLASRLLASEALVEGTKLRSGV